MPAQHNLLSLLLNLEFRETINQTLSFQSQMVSYFAALSLIKPVHVFHRQMPTLVYITAIKMTVMGGTAEHKKLSVSTSVE